MTGDGLMAQHQLNHLRRHVPSGDNDAGDVDSDEFDDLWERAVPVDVVVDRRRLLRPVRGARTPPTGPG